MKSLLYLCLMVAVFMLSCNKDKDFPQPQSPIYELEYLELGKVKLSFPKLDLLNSNYVIDWGDGRKTKTNKNKVEHQYPYNSFYQLAVVAITKDSTVRKSSFEGLNILSCKSKVAIITKKLKKDDFVVFSLGGSINASDSPIGILGANYQRPQLPYWDMKPDKDVLIVELGTRRNYEIHSQKIGELETKLEKRIYTQDNLSFQTIEL